MDFDNWLKQELSKEAGKHYNPNGNSSRAVMKRGLFGQFKWVSKKLIPSIYSEIKYGFSGWETGIGYILSLLLLPLFIWVMPFTRTYGTYKRAFDDYKDSYAQYLITQK